MKVLIIHREEDKKIADRIKLFLEKEKITIEIFDLKAHSGISVNAVASMLDRSDFGKNKNDQAESVSHVLIVSPLPRLWFDFLAGFTCGSAVPILVCGEGAIADIPKQVVFAFSTFLTEDSLQRHFENEAKAFTKQEEARRIINAQESLLRMGIPLTREAMAQCAETGKVKEITLFLAAGFSPDTRNTAGVPLLNIAARKKNMEAIKFLVSAGSQLNLTSEDRGSTALIDAVMSNRADIVKELIKAGAELNTKSKDGQTALVIAVGAGEENIVEALLKAGADPDISDSMGTSARMYATLFHKAAITSLFAKYAPKKEG